MAAEDQVTQTPYPPASWAGLLVMALLVLGACDGPERPSDGPAVFRVRACEGSSQAPGGQDFRIELRDQQRIAEAEALIGSPIRFVSGTVREGDGGVNQPWSWHLEPASIRFVENAIELCDGCPSSVEQDLAGWVNQTYCPWSSRIVSRER